MVMSSNSLQIVWIIVTAFPGDSSDVLPWSCFTTSPYLSGFPLLILSLQLWLVLFTRRGVKSSLLTLLPQLNAPLHLSDPVLINLLADVCKSVHHQRMGWKYFWSPLFVFLEIQVIIWPLILSALLCVTTSKRLCIRMKGNDSAASEGMRKKELMLCQLWWRTKIFNHEGWTREECYFTQMISWWITLLWSHSVPQHIFPPIHTTFIL